jgi:hypothetical protein
VEVLTTGPDPEVGQQHAENGLDADAASRHMNMAVNRVGRNVNVWSAVSAARMPMPRDKLSACLVGQVVAIGRCADVPAILVPDNAELVTESQLHRAYSL